MLSQSPREGLPEDSPPLTRGFATSAESLFPTVFLTELSTIFLQPDFYQSSGRHRCFDCDFDWILAKQEQVNCENPRCGLGRVIQIFTL